MNRKLHDLIGAVTLLKKTTVAATAATAWLDLKGVQACDLLIRVEALTGVGSITPSLQDSETTADTGAAAAASGDVVGTLAAVEAATDEVLQRVAYVGSKSRRYCRVLLTVAGAASADVTVIALAASGVSEPAADPVAAAAT